MQINQSEQFGPITERVAEKASNSYLMSMIAIMAGIGMPIINLIATFIFFMANRKGEYFVRWHCTQALLSQLLLVAMNSTGFVWLMNIIFGEKTFTAEFFAYVAILLMVNIIEFIATVYAAIRTRKGLHVEWWLLGPFTNMICHRGDKNNNLINS